MMIKYYGKKIGGHISIFDWQLKWYFYWVKESLGHGKVLAKVYSNS